MKASEVKIGQKVRFINVEENTEWDNYYGRTTHMTKREYTGVIHEILSKQSVIVEVGYLNYYPVEIKKLKNY